MKGSERAVRCQGKAVIGQWDATMERQRTQSDGWVGRGMYST